MLPFLLSETAALLRTLQAALLFLLAAALMPMTLRSAEPQIVALHGFESAEVRQQGFTLPRSAKIHVYAKGGGLRRIVGRSGDNSLFAYGWILNALTREVVWQMDGANSRRDWEFWVADQYLELPAGSYEAYFANHGFGQSLLLAQWTRNIDRRNIQALATERPHGFLAAFSADNASLLRHWREQVGHYGMEIYLPSGDPKEVTTFAAPLRWKNLVLTLSASTDNGHWSQSFRVRKPMTVHLYAEGEGSGKRLHDFGWIIDARTRTRVWEMSLDKSSYAGGARKNRRQVESLQLPAGDYEATFVTDDTHSPADWNGAPPCDPGLYGLRLSVPSDAELSALVLTRPFEWKVLTEQVKVGSGQDRKAPFVLATGQSVRVYAIGEGDGKELADTAWIEDAAGKRVWAMEAGRTHHAGGAAKNRCIDELVSLPKGSYILRFKTDDSHAYGDWNSDQPRDAEHYGATVYTGK